MGLYLFNVYEIQFLSLSYYLIPSLVKLSKTCSKIGVDLQECSLWMYRLKEVRLKILYRIQSHHEIFVQTRATTEATTDRDSAAVGHSITATGRAVLLHRLIARELS